MERERESLLMKNILTQYKKHVYIYVLKTKSFLFFKKEIKKKKEEIKSPFLIN